MSAMRCLNYLYRIFLIVIFSINWTLKAQDFEVAPVSLEFSAEPGDNQTKTLTVKNHSNSKASFIVSLGDFLPSSIGEKNAMPPNSTKRSCANWININPSFFEINPGDEIQVQVSMLVPNVEYNSAWCMLYIQTTKEQTSWNADKNLGAGMSVSGRIVVYIYQSPKSNINNSLKIGNLTEITKIGETTRKFNATIENLGDRITKCKVYLIASNMKTTEEKQFEAIEIETFPKMSRTIELTLPNVLEPGAYSLAAIVDYGSKYALEGTQILIDIKGLNTNTNIDTTQTKVDQSIK